MLSDTVVGDSVGVLGRLIASLGSSMEVGHGLLVAVWAGYGAGSPGASVGDTRPRQGGATGAVSSSVPSPETVAPEATGTSGEGESNKARDEIRLADVAHGQVYVCFEGPLGIHLKQ